MPARAAACRNIPAPLTQLAGQPSSDLLCFLQFGSCLIQGRRFRLKIRIPAFEAMALQSRQALPAFFRKCDVGQPPTARDRASAEARQPWPWSRGPSMPSPLPNGERTSLAALSVSPARPQPLRCPLAIRRANTRSAVEHPSARFLLQSQGYRPFPVGSICPRVGRPEGVRTTPAHRRSGRCCGRDRSRSIRSRCRPPSGSPARRPCRGSHSATASARCGRSRRRGWRHPP